QMGPARAAIPPARALPRRPFLLRAPHPRRHDPRAGVPRPTLKGVVEVLAMGSGAIDEGRARRAGGAGVTDGGGRASLRPCRQRRDDVIAMAGERAHGPETEHETPPKLAHPPRPPGARARAGTARPGAGPRCGVPVQRATL